VVVPGLQDRFTWALGLSLLLGCLPSASIETAAEPALTDASSSGTAGEQCRALISERSDRGPLTHELRWDRERIRSTQSFAGMVVGTADELFAIWATRSRFDGLDLYGVGEPDLSCEADVIWVRRMPHGAKQPLVEAAPACVGTVDGQPIAIESNLNLLSAIGPLIGWRARVQGHDPSPIAHLDYQTIDLRTFTRAAPRDWLLEPTASMVRPESERSGCAELDVPTSFEVTRGFALRWHDRGLPRMHIGYTCCKHDPTPQSCEIDDPLPRPDPELAAMLPDADSLLHSPFGCGSIGLDGSVRRRDGAPVGQHDVEASKLLGVVFLPSEHPFEPSWLGSNEAAAAQ
jgi:hypothetical protein